MSDKASFEDLEFMLKIIGETLEVEALTKDDMFQIIRLLCRKSVSLQISQSITALCTMRLSIQLAMYPD